MTPPPIPETVQSIAPSVISVSDLLNASSGGATPEPIELTGQETRIQVLHPDLHVQPDGRDRPRIGGWFVGQPRESARVPDLVVPLGADDGDDDDRPLLDEHGGQQDKPGEAGMGTFWDRPWIEAKRLAKEKQKEDEANRLIVLQQEKTRAQEDALRAQQEAQQIKAEASAQRHNSTSSLSQHDIRQLIHSSHSVPSFLKSDLLEYTQVAMDESTPGPADRRKLLPSTSRVLGKGVWVITLHGDTSTSQSVPVLTCVPSRMLCTASHFPREACDVFLTAPHLSPWYDAQSNKLDDDGKVVSRSAPASAEQTTIPNSTTPTAPDVTSLQEQITTLEKQCAELKTANKSLSREAADASQALDAAQRNAQASRQLYHQASENARVALSESAEAEDKMAKLQRQLTDGLAAHKERFNVARAAWKEEERQLKARIHILESQDRRAGDADVRRKMNEWRVAKMNEEAAAKQAQEVQKRVAERLKAEEEIDDDELAALRQEAQMGNDDDAVPAAATTTTTSLSSRSRRPRRAAAQASEMNSQVVTTPIEPIPSSGEEVNVSEQGPFAGPTTAREPSPDLLSDLASEGRPSSYASIAAEQNAEASRLLAAARQKANLTASTTLHPAGSTRESMLTANDLSRLQEDKEQAEQLQRAQADFIERSVRVLPDGEDDGSDGPPDPDDVREETEDMLATPHGQKMFAEYMEVFREREKRREEQGLVAGGDTSAGDVDLTEWMHDA